MGDLRLQVEQKPEHEVKEDPEHDGHIQRHHDDVEHDDLPSRIFGPDGLNRSVEKTTRKDRKRTLFVRIAYGQGGKLGLGSAL